jgi:hypothetical protein
MSRLTVRTKYTCIGHYFNPIKRDLYCEIGDDVVVFYDENGNKIQMSYYDSTDGMNLLDAMVYLRHPYKDGKSCDFKEGIFGWDGVSF